MSSLSQQRSHKEILVVDDTPDNLRLLSAILTRKNYEVRKALSGAQAIASVKADAPDLILLDIKMPDMNGYEACAAIKADPNTQEIPIIFISALDDALDKVKAFEVGGADYIAKPFQEAELLVRIANQLHLRDLQFQLKARNEELIQSNQELEQFAHIVSHDLQQPLQSIIGYTKIIGMQYPDLLETPVHQYLNRVLEAGHQMQRLIEDLLSHAKMGHGEYELSPIDCNLVLSQALTQLDVAIKESHVKLQYPELPTVLGNDIQLVQLFQNLISNAIKFRRPEVDAQIIISAVLADESDWVFTVQDNGIGISSEHIAHIFRNFQRSHSSEQYPGLGIGLATCKKIIENHGGEIWVDSAVNVGSTFYFKLKGANTRSAN